MTLDEFITSEAFKTGGAAIVLLLSFIKIPKLEVNFWGWLGKMVGNCVNGELIKKIDAIDEKATEIQNRLNSHCKENQEYTMQQARTQILRFNDEILCGVKHTQEHYNQIMESIDTYENYCLAHPDFPNNKAKSSIENIRHTYNECLKNHDFL